MILAILQARISSSRLPGKVVKKILGKEMILYEIERLQQSKYIDKLVLATSIESTDDDLEDICNRNKIECFRGSLNDVLDRYYKCALSFNAKHVVRITGDCPLIDSEVVDKVIFEHLDSKSDYTSNTNPPTYPDGLDVEVMRFSVLEEAWKKATLKSEREHVTLYIRNNSNKFRQKNVENDKDLSNMRWTVDEPEDFEFVNNIISNLYLHNYAFNKNDILKYLDNHPEIKYLNSGFRRNEGLQKSLLNDKLLGKED